jgi:hypothetical protein
MSSKKSKAGNGVDSLSRNLLLEVVKLKSTRQSAVLSRLERRKYLINLDLRDFDELSFV